MMKFAAISIAALAASTAFAQAPSAAPATTAAEPAPMTQPAPSESAPSAAAPSGEASTTAQVDPAAGTAPASANAQVVAVVEAGFPKYDADKDGNLSDAEFKQWISDLKTAEIAAAGKPADAAAVTQYASAALGAADKDKNSIVTKAELTSFLGG